MGTTVKGHLQAASIPPLLLKLVLVLFVAELTIDSLLPQLLPAVLPLQRTLADALILALVTVFAAWQLFYQPVASSQGNDLALIHTSLAKLALNAAIVTFVVELSTMAIVPYLLGGRGVVSWCLVDASLVVAISAPLLWLIAVRTLEGGRRFSANSLYSGSTLLVKLLAAFLAIELVSRGMLHQFVPEDETAIVAVAEMLVEPILVSIVIWWLVLEPLRRMAVSEKTRFDAVSLQMVDAVIITDGQGMILTPNPAAELLFRYAPGEMEGEGVGILFPGVSSLAALMGENRMAGPASVAREVVGLRRDGTQVHLDVTVSRVAQGEQSICMAIMRDNSERKWAEESRLHTISLLEATLESSADGILVVDTDRKVQVYNRRFAEMMDLPSELGATSNSLRFVEYFKKLVTNPEGFVERVEELYRHPDMEDYSLVTFHDGRVIERYSRPQRLGDRIIGRVWSFRDVTARIQTEQSLKESEERFRQIFEQSEDAIILFDPATCSIIDANPTTEKIYGYDRNEIVDRGLGAICTPSSIVRMRDFICGDHREGAFRADIIDNRRKDGTGIIVSARGKTIRLQGRDAVYCTFRDITERIRLEKEASSIQAKLIHTNKMTSLGIMATSIAHEINNPNNYILANAQLLESVWHDAEAIMAEYLEQNGDFTLAGLSFSGQRDAFPGMITGIRDGSDRIRDIVSNLRGFAGQGTANLHGNVDCNKVVSFAVTLTSHLVPRYTRHFSVELADELPPVKGNTRLLEQVVLNLIMNALQSLPDPERGVWVSTCHDRDRGTVSITVRDEGAGMTEAVAHRIMEPFFTTKLDRGGSGLGLSISQAIVRDHGGTMDFRSELGKGTVFIVSFPAYPLHKGADDEA